MGDYQKGYNDGIKGGSYKVGDYGGYLAGRQEQERQFQSFGVSDGDYSSTILVMAILLYCAASAGLLTWGYVELYDWTKGKFSTTYERRLDEKTIMENKRFLKPYYGDVKVAETIFVTVEPPWIDKFKFKEQTVFITLAILNFVLVLSWPAYTRFALGITMLSITLGVFGFAASYLWVLVKSWIA